jgi:hypothetical protein
MLEDSNIFLHKKKIQKLLFFEFLNISENNIISDEA